MKTIHNHKSKISDYQSASFRSIVPGMVITFNYLGLKISDKNPLILFMHFDRKNGLIEGLNLNYLSNYRFKKLFEGFAQRTSVGDVPKESSNLITEDYTFITLPPISKMSRLNSRSEAQVEMKRLYKNYVGPKFNEIYRSYTPMNMKTIKIVNLKDY